VNRRDSEKDRAGHACTQTHTYRAEHGGDAFGPPVESESGIEYDDVVPLLGLGLGCERFVDDVVGLGALRIGAESGLSDLVVGRVLQHPACALWGRGGGRARKRRACQINGLMHACRRRGTGVGW